MKKQSKKPKGFRAFDAFHFLTTPRSNDPKTSLRTLSLILILEDLGA